METVKTLSAKNPELNKKIIEKIEKSFFYLLEEFAPRKTGAYIRSWRTESKTDNRIVFSTTMNDLFIILEFGVDHDVVITPKNASVLHFFVDGAEVFTKKVTIPPRPPKPHIRTAVNDLKRDIPQMINLTIKEVYPFLK